MPRRRTTWRSLRPLASRCTKEVNLVSAVQYVCMITDLLLKDGMVTIDDTTRSGSVSPYFEALHIICLLTPSVSTVCVDADEHSDATERTSSSPQTPFETQSLVCSVLTSARLSIHPLTSLNQIARSRCGTVTVKSSSCLSQD
ncbi:hypothetical protein BLNAU_24138 [Blattamonas nauphoetae]|uniref:Uncharacterized protein n=1 Tax=Blattamonas nauphoetae TaxID=2049346 RepID=A0ABQ9WN94_9EUKA|nr:hypothetical protein BLNAU_24138 [Blattamonas nauphoetae]